MTYVVTEACADTKDRSCVEQCPVDCIYEGARAMYIHPDECIDCGACEPACPVDAIYYETDLPQESSAALAGNAAFFTLPIPGRSEPLGRPGGFANVGPVDVDSEFVAALPDRTEFT